MREGSRPGIPPVSMRRGGRKGGAGLHGVEDGRAEPVTTGDDAWGRRRPAARGRVDRAVAVLVDAAPARRKREGPAVLRRAQNRQRAVRTSTVTDDVDG